MTDLYDIARKVTDEVLGEGTYAKINEGNPDPGVQAAIKRSQQKRRGRKPKPIPVNSDLPFIQRMLVGAVRDRLRELDVTQEWLAETIGITPKHMSQMMQGKASGSFAVWQKIMDALEIEVGFRRRGQL